MRSISNSCFRADSFRTESVIAIFFFAAFIFAATAFCVVELKANDFAAAKPGDVFRDCPDCPEMVVIPAGSFTMGSSASEKTWAATHGWDTEQHKIPLRSFALAVADEAPQHKVSLRSFALGKYDVTRREYAAFVSETGYRSDGGCSDNGGPNSPKRAGASWKNPGFKQTDNDPVICVSWDDAEAYVSWLNRTLQRSGSASGDGPYRLPTESEWEYAARAGTTTRFWWGNDESTAAAHAWYKENSGGQTHPVGLKPANRFGLYDMAGNVWQWTQDCYAESYAAAPNNGTVAEMGNQCLRVDRGGSWNYATWLLRSATRERNPPDYRDRVMGFAWQRRCRELRAYVPDFRSNERKANPFGVGIRQCRCDHLYCRAATRCQ
ncbi:MAG: hypothetical protein DME76_11640 [Verrucomicrobia bacterium]|nr:MAG: hypothetical protein DME76_11640 [Verrucomicrobiota bacterium]